MLCLEDLCEVDPETDHEAPGPYDLEVADYLRSTYIPRREFKRRDKNTGDDSSDK